MGRSPLLAPVANLRQEWGVMLAKAIRIGRPFPWGSAEPLNFLPAAWSNHRAENGYLDRRSPVPLAPCSRLCRQLEDQCLWVLAGLCWPPISGCAEGPAQPHETQTTSQRHRPQDL
jgi:hypothetical protein